MGASGHMRAWCMVHACEAPTVVRGTRECSSCCQSKSLLQSLQMMFLHVLLFCKSHVDVMQARSMQIVRGGVESSRMAWHMPQTDEPQASSREAQLCALTSRSTFSTARSSLSGSQLRACVRQKEWARRRWCVYAHVFMHVCVDTCAYVYVCVWIRARVHE